MLVISDSTLIYIHLYSLYLEKMLTLQAREFKPVDTLAEPLMPYKNGRVQTSGIHDALINRLRDGVHSSEPLPYQGSIGNFLEFGDLRSSAIMEGLGLQKGCIRQAAR